MNKMFKCGRKFLAIIMLLIIATAAARIVDIERPRETWDEITTYSVGLSFWYNIAKLDFRIESWSLSPHPPFARYAYGLVNGIYMVLQKGPGIFSLDRDSAIAMMYELKNYTPGRLLSAFLASGTALLIFLMANRRLGLKAAVMSSLVFALLPVSLAQTRIAALDSMMVFLFTLAVWLFLKSSGRDRNFCLSAIVAGLAISTKLNALSLFLLLPAIYLIEGGRFSRSHIPKVVAYPLVGVLVFFALWPVAWYWSADMLGFASLVADFWTDYSNVSEYFFGSLSHPFYYAPAYVFATTPALILVFFAAGIYFSWKKSESRIFLAWLLVPLLAFMLFQLFSPSAISQAGPRYVFMIYPALSIIAGYGIVKLSECLSRARKAPLCAIPSITTAASQHGTRIQTHNILPYAVPIITIAYLIMVSVSVHPYYLDYYNELVGGPSNVYNNRMFAIGQWGEGIDEAALWLNENAAENATVQFFVMPRHVIPPLRSDITDITPFIPKYISETGDAQNLDMSNVTAKAMYIVENTFFRLYPNESFHERISSDYAVIKTAEVMGAPLAWVYKYRIQ